MVLARAGREDVCNERERGRQLSELHSHFSEDRSEQSASMRHKRVQA